MSWSAYFEDFLFLHTFKKIDSKKSVARERPFFDYIMFLLGVLINRKLSHLSV